MRGLWRNDDAGMNVGAEVVYGRTLPRVYTPPLPGRRIEDVEAGRALPGGCPCGCALSPSTSDGFEAVEWIEGDDGLAVTLFPWERWAAIHALELLPGGLYRFRVILILVARQNGKTLLKSALTLWRMFARNEKYLVGTAQDLSQAREVMNEVLVPMIQDRWNLRPRFDPDHEEMSYRRGIWHKTLNDEYFRLDCRWRGGRAGEPWGPRYLIKALNRKAGRGLSDVSEVNIDELREQQDWKGWGAVSKTMMANEHGQIWCMSNAGDDQSVVLLHLRSVGLSGEDETLFLAEWSAPVGCELDDVEAWAQANPSMNLPGSSLTERSIRSAMHSDPPAVFRTEVLCQFVDALSSAVDAGAWSAGADVVGSVSDLSRPVIGVECAVEADQVVAVAASWAASGRVRLEVVGVWSSTARAKDGLAELQGVLRPVGAGWFPKGPGSRMSHVMRQLAFRPVANGSGPGKATEINGTKVAEACMTFADWVDQRRVVHSDDAMLNAHVGRVGSVGSAASWAFSRGPSEVHAAWAAAAALHVLLAGPRRPVGRPKRMLFPPD